MKLSFLFPAVLACAALVFASFSTPTVQDPDEDKTPLQTYMSQINRGLRGLRSMLRDADRKDEALETTRNLQLLTMKAKLEKPIQLKDIPDAKKVEFMNAYQKEMIPMLEGFLNLEKAILEGDMEKAGDIRSAVNKLKSEAHKKFKVKD